MGKRLIVQARGAGGPRYRAPGHKYNGEVKYRFYDSHEKEGIVRGRIIEFINDPGRNSLLAVVEYEDGEKGFLIANEGLREGSIIECGARASVKHGNILPLKNIPEGSFVYNIEALPGDGGKFVRSAGTYALLIAHDNGNTIVQFPSGAVKTVLSLARATLGIAAGGGRRERPILKAGKRHYMLHSRPKIWPKVRGKAMNTVDHPYGGGSKQCAGKPKTVSRNAPPGRKVGLIAARRTGRK